MIGILRPSCSVFATRGCEGDDQSIDADTTSTCKRADLAQACSWICSAELSLDFRVVSHGQTTVKTTGTGIEWDHRRCRRREIPKVAARPFLRYLMQPVSTKIIPPIEFNLQMWTSVVRSFKLLHLDEKSSWTKPSCGPGLLGVRMRGCRGSRTRALSALSHLRVEREPRHRSGGLSV